MLPGMEMNAETVALGLMWFAAFLFSTTFHEAAHAWSALRLGDPTAYHGGQVTLNPLPHIQREPIGMVVVPLLSFFIGGWMMGWASAPYDPYWADRYPKRAALMALAGPMSNLLIATVAGVVLRLGFAQGPALQLLWILFTLNLLLFVFNLLPVPPLDGSALPPLLLSDSAARSYLEFIREPMWTMVGLLVAWRAIGFVFPPIFAVAEALVLGGL